MNTSVITTEDRVYAGVFGCIMVIGLPLNAVALWILLCRHSLQSPNAVFMVNLAVSDLLVIISLPMRIYFHATRSWPLSNIMCQFITMLFRNNIRSSSFFITFISMDRLLAVVYPLRSCHLRTSSNAWKGAAVVWLFVLLMNVPWFMDLKRFKNRNNATCFGTVSMSATQSAVIYLYMVLIITMLAVNIVCTIMVSWTLCNRPSDTAKINKRVNVMLIFAMNLVLFTICFLPVQIGLATKSFAHLTPLVCLAAVNCCFDPLLYYFSFDSFWKKKEDAMKGGEM
ncbi:lysophosphatidic acid receptor 6-like [Astatotilapia calliptera]|uniref:G-protein coupled receptors family 1 profile domain-containing protein n=1 Tax=Astatotilapia calliptera TaxID=8154 RepID=A0A3P8PL04_ASTCA|nr:lysophosphatidic acid receptor 6-like [Astatotilapia calliptera]